MAEKTIITKEGLAQLEGELMQRKNQIRQEIADEIERAREQGDLSENASYKAAMEKKEYNETKISALEETINNSIIQEGTTSKTLIGMGSEVLVHNLTNNKKTKYTLVGQNEADPVNGKISVASPLGVLLIGKRKGQTLTFTTPLGTQQLDILEIN